MNILTSFCPSKCLKKKKNPTPEPWYQDGKELIVLSLNMEFYHKYCAAKDKTSYEQYLIKEIENVDVLCVQEDLLFWSEKFLQKDKPFFGFERIISSINSESKVSKLKEMVYEDETAMATMRKNGLTDDHFSSRLGNSIYLNKESGWRSIRSKVVQISTDQELPSKRSLGYRSVVCATLRYGNIQKAVQVLCTHLSGGRFEDLYMSDVLKLERATQMQRCLEQKDDTADNVLVGDFNASVTRTKALDGYLDLLRKGQQPDLTNSDYYSYMMAPFTALTKSRTDWNLLYKVLDGPTSAFGHEIDFFVTSPHMYVQTPYGKSPKIERVRMIGQYMPWIKPTADEDFGNVLEEPITDHNGVKVTFFQPTEPIVSDIITFFSLIESSKWAEKLKEVKAVILDGDEKAKSNPPDLVYPILQHTYTKDGPTLSEHQSLVDLINEAQRPLWDIFLEEGSFSTLQTFMSECAIEEKRILTKYGWWVQADWYSIKESQQTLRFTEEMTAAHKSLHGKLLSVRVLRELLRTKMIRRK